MSFNRSTDKLVPLYNEMLLSRNNSNKKLLMQTKETPGQYAEFKKKKKTQKIICCMIPFIYMTCFFGGTGISTQSLSDTSSPFCSGYFGDGLLGTICSG
jgi:hypothetical protein